jgi:hypothetical protein
MTIDCAQMRFSVTFHLSRLLLPAGELMQTGIIGGKINEFKTGIFYYRLIDGSFVLPVPIRHEAG